MSKQTVGTVKRYGDTLKSIKDFSSPNRYRNDKGYEELEEEIKALEAKEAGEEDTSDDNSKGGDPESKGKESKKDDANDFDSPMGQRYKNLQSYHTKTVNELKRQVQELQEKQNSQPKSYPTTEEEFNKWREEYPQSAKMIEMLVIKHSESNNNEYKKTVQELEEEKHRLAFDRTYAQLLKLAPDFEELRVSPDFMAFEQTETGERMLVGGWLAEQPSAVQAAILQPELNDAGARWAAKVVNMYKAERGLDKKKEDSTTRRDENTSAATKVTKSGSSAPNSDGNKKVWKESDVEKMSEKEFIKNMDDINAAQIEGRFEYDISGGGR